MKLTTRQVTLKEIKSNEITKKAITLNTINFLADGHKAALHRGVSYYTCPHKLSAIRALINYKRKEGWCIHGLYECMWFELRDALIDFEDRFNINHKLSNILFNLECPPLNNIVLTDNKDKNYALEVV